MQDVRLRFTPSDPVIAPATGGPLASPSLKPQMMLFPNANRNRSTS